ncbi:restriction endonuclease subunit S [Zobellia alginiliquefaciens]|uniref:restriction endonuclease subunit S n=1 Tax=Zobellia alginiliquefaciens TaxID=3032586 RepID=UPI0023E3AA87|nr:restriction endonuclease subunit S [Zobellia alginiliquefaciens]
MMESWKEELLGNLLEIKSSKRIFLSDYVEKGIPFFRSKEIIESFKGQDISLELFIEKDKYLKIKEKYGVPQLGDILITSVGSIGVPYLVKNEEPFYFKDGNLIWIKFNKSKNKTLSKFLYYFIVSPYGQAKLDSVLIGSSQKALTISGLRKIKINLPPLKTQRKIASILSGYDDLIEINLKRINLLEEQAQQTYEEWFVRFKFPGYEDVETDKESGLPVGWEKKKIQDVIEVGRGSSPRPISNQKYFEGGTIPWLKIADATSSHIYIYETKLYVNEYGASFSRKLPKGSIVVAASGTLGFPMILGVEACIHDGWLYFKGIDDKLKEYFYFSFIGLKSYFESISYGAAIQNINTGIVRQSPFIVPSEDISIKFKTFASKVFESISNLQNQNQHLKEARDILLPRLMSGMIDVDGLEVETNKTELIN